MARRGISLTVLLVGFGFAAAIPSKAAAQTAGAGDEHFQRNRNTSVAQRREARDDEGGWRVGAFRINPELDLSAGYSDNYAASENDPQSSLIYEADARLNARSDWGRHAVNASLYIPTTSYEDHFTMTDVIVGADGRYDIDHSLAINGGVGYGYRSEPLGFSPAGQELREPLRYRQSSALVGFIKTFNRLRFAGSASYGRNDYGDGKLTNGTSVSFDERDVSFLSYDVRADYAVSDSTALFVSVSANSRDHSDDLAVNQDSDGYEYLVGANFDLTRLLRGEIGVGYLSQSYDDPATEDATGLALRGSVEWFIDPLVTISLGAQRNVQDSYSVETGTFIGTDINLNVSYEFRRNINFSLSSGYSQDEYNGIDRDDTRWSAYGSAEYIANRTVSFSLRAGHEAQDSSGADRGRNYDANVASFGIRLRR